MERRRRLKMWAYMREVADRLTGAINARNVRRLGGQPPVRALPPAEPSAPVVPPAEADAGQQAEVAQ